MNKKEDLELATSLAKPETKELLSKFLLDIKSIYGNIRANPYIAHKALWDLRKNLGSRFVDVIIADYLTEIAGNVYGQRYSFPSLAEFKMKRLINSAQK